MTQLTKQVDQVSKDLDEAKASLAAVTDERDGLKKSSGTGCALCRPRLHAADRACAAS